MFSLPMRFRRGATAPASGGVRPRLAASSTAVKQKGEIFEEFSAAVQTIAQVRQNPCQPLQDPALRTWVEARMSGTVNGTGVVPAALSRRESPGFRARGRRVRIAEAACGHDKSDTNFSER
jgi:hypothetical protein